MIKKIFFTLTILTLLSKNANSQNYEGMGFKIGANYNSNGDYNELNSINTVSSKKNIGYHIGFFGKIGKDVFFRPEFIYTFTKSEYDAKNLSIQKADIPLLIGVQVLESLSIFAGPTVQYLLDAKFNDITMNQVKNEFPIGLNVGIGINKKQFGVDLRYERGINDNEAIFVNKSLNGFDRINTRPEQLILSVSVFLF